MDEKMHSESNVSPLPVFLLLHKLNGEDSYDELLI